MRARRLPISLFLIVATILAGLVIRFAPLGLPTFIVKYGGSALWAITIYWLITTLFLHLPIPRAALLTGTIATAVEFFKLYHTPWVDTFRTTLPGVLLLGRFFSYRDILAYWLAIMAAAALDRFLRSASRISPAKLVS